MNVSIPSILASLGGKCLLNWVLVFLQRNHVCRSFVGVFSVSLSVFDTTLTVVLTAIHLHAGGQVFLFGLQMTRYHICLLFQIAGQVYSALQVPVVVVAGLDHFFSIFQRLQPATCSQKWTVHSFVTILLWFASTLYVFLLSDFSPVLEDVSHHHIRQCWAFHNFEILQVALFLFLTVVYATLHTGFLRRFLKNPPLGDQSRADSRMSVTSRVLHVFLNTWTIFLLFLAILLLLSVAVPSCLGLNVAWLCFLNSLLFRVASSVVCPSLHMANALAADPVSGDLNLAWLQRTAPEWPKKIHAGNTVEAAESGNDT